ncbi:Myb/SANT-like DNA-binding domain containing 2 [Columba livia]|uniref:Myb/SANT-like DNA-binding domain containing 2 n=1 Tax=Columba livia TaxID=8932 RepID=A0A2I0LS87_COLLI|nr:Myb/SANT-like DNA-binding domain containing 2 [Columba livia]
MCRIPPNVPDPSAAGYAESSLRGSWQLHKRQSELVRKAKYTLRRCYSRVKEHGVGKRKSSYTFEQLEQVFGQGGWDSQPCQPVLINSSGLYQELESDGSTMEEYSQEDWGNHSQDLHCYQTGEQELDEMPPTKRTLKIKQESSEDTQRRDAMQNIVRILESVQLKWEQFQSWTDFSRLHLSNKLAIFGIGYNTRWKDDIRPLPLRRDQLPGPSGQAPARVFQLGETRGPRHHDAGAEDELEERLLQVPGDHHQRGALPRAAHGDRLDPHRPLQTQRGERGAVFITRRHPQKPRVIRHRLRGVS